MQSVAMSALLNHKMNYRQTIAGETRIRKSNAKAQEEARVQKLRLAQVQDFMQRK